MHLAYFLLVRTTHLGPALFDRRSWVNDWKQGILEAWADHAQCKTDRGSPLDQSIRIGRRYDRVHAA